MATSTSSEALTSSEPGKPRQSPQPKTVLSPELATWYLGGYEGQPNDAVDAEIEYLVCHPDEKPPGRHPDSTQDGETFNQFRVRVLRFIHRQLRDLGAQQIEIDFTHGRVMRLVDAHVHAGFPADLSIDVEYFLRKDDPDHAQLARLWRERRRVFYEPEPIDSKDPFVKASIYLSRHGATEMD